MVTLGKIGHAVSETAILYAMLGTSMTGLLNPLAYAYWDKSYRGGYKKALERVLLLCTCSKLKTENMPGNTHCYSMPTSGTAFNKTLQFFYRPYIVSMKISILQLHITPSWTRLGCADVMRSRRYARYFPAS